MKPIKVLLAGEGGQGIQTMAKIIAESAVEAGYKASYIPSFGVEQRGTPSVAFVIISKNTIFYPRFLNADYAVVMQKRAVKTISNYISPSTKIIFDSSTMSVTDLPKKSVHIFATPATKYAYDNFTPKSFNLIVTGKISHILNLPAKAVWQTIKTLLGRKFKNGKIEEVNRNAFNFGYNLVFEVKQFSEPDFCPSQQKIISIGHGKEGEIVPTRCKGCGLCIEKCPVRALRFSTTLGLFATPVPEVDLEKCIDCGNCRRFCPDGAINIEKN